MSTDREVPNPGNRRCRLCGGLITDPTVVYSGCNVRHVGCTSGLPRLGKQATIKRPSRQRRKPSRHLKDDA